MTAPDPATVERLRVEIQRAHDRLPGVETELMNGDNLAVTLCSYFDDAEGEQDDNGWTEAATDGYDQVIAAIRAHYQAPFDSLLDALTVARAEIAGLKEALEPFAHWRVHKNEPGLADVLIGAKVADIRAARAAVGGG